MDSKSTPGATTPETTAATTAVATAETPPRAAVSPIPVRAPGLVDLDSQLRDVFDRIHLVGVILDRAGRAAYANRFYFDLTGFLAADILGRDWFLTALPPDEADRVRAFYEGMIEQRNAPAVAENEIITCRGERRLIRWSNVLLRDAEGGVTGTASFGEDVTEARHAEARLREGEARLGLALESANAAIWEWTPASGTTFFGDRWYTLLGYAPGEFPATSANWLRLVHPADRGRVMEGVATGVVDEAGASEYEMRILSRDGSWRWFLCRARVIASDASGQPTRVVGASVDITQRKHGESVREDLEAQLRQSQKMEAIGRLAGGIAHDFNNMLSVILSYAAMMSEELPPESPMTEDVAEIKKAGERAAALTRQLLAFSRQQLFTPQVIDLNEAVGDIARISGRILGEDVVISLTLERPLGLVRADRGQVDQLLMNLVVNARDALPSGGKLFIETAELELDELYAEAHLGVRPGRYVMLAVTDTGIGMSHEVRARLFEPFFTTKPKGKGTGLGLSTVFGIVKQCGGHIGVYSEPGHGATFKVYFPVAEVDARAEVDRPREPKNPPRIAELYGNETVLLVEDEGQVRAIARAILQRYGYRVLEARDAQEALMLFDIHGDRIDLLLTDVVMPGMNGVQLAQRLRSRKPALRVLAMSGYTDEAVVHLGLVESGMAFLQKPLTPDRLARKLREVLGAFALR